MLLTGKWKVDDVCHQYISRLSYAKTPDARTWKINVVKEIQEAKYGALEIPKLNNSEIKNILKYVCTS